MAKEKKKWSTRKKVITLLIALFAFFIVNMIAARIIFHCIFYRYNHTNQNIDLVYTAEDELNYPRQDIKFKSGDNTLTGRLYTAKDPQAVIIIIHGIHAYGDRYIKLAEYFVDKNYDVITFNGTGTADSDGSDTIGLAQTKLDLLATVDYVHKNKEIKDLPILLFGHSAGGYAAATAIAKASDIKGVVCVSAFDRPTDIMVSTSKKYVGFLATISYPFMWLENYRRFGSDANIRASEVLKDSKIPVLVVYGSSDDIIPTEYALYSKKKEINNPLVSYYYVDEKYRSEHSTPWYTIPGAKYSIEINNAFDKLVKKYDHKIPAKVFDSFYKDIDMAKLYDLNLDFMAMIDDFYKKSLAK